jgi:hypothetical protein
MSEGPDGLYVEIKDSKIGEVFHGGSLVATGERMDNGGCPNHLEKHFRATWYPLIEGGKGYQEGMCQEVKDENRTEYRRCHHIRPKQGFFRNKYTGN